MGEKVWGYFEKQLKKQRRTVPMLSCNKKNYYHPRFMTKSIMIMGHRTEYYIDY